MHLLFRDMYRVSPQLGSPLQGLINITSSDVDTCSNERGIACLVSTNGIENILSNLILWPSVERCRVKHVWAFGESTQIAKMYFLPYCSEMEFKRRDVIVILI